MRRLRAYFLTGLLTLLPIWLVWIVFKFVLGLLRDMSQPVVAPASARLAARHPEWLGWVDDPWAQSAFAIAATVVVIIAVGALARRVVGQQLRGCDAAGAVRQALTPTPLPVRGRGAFGAARKPWRWVTGQRLRGRTRLTAAGPPHQLCGEELRCVAAPSAAAGKGLY